MRPSAADNLQPDRRWRKGKRTQYDRKEDRRQPANDGSVSGNGYTASTFGKLPRLSMWLRYAPVLTGFTA
jgi:hypothetical protein